jgi:stage III sporulation protein AB
MLKLIGASLILLSMTLGGFHFAQKLSNRTRQLRELQMNLQLLETEIFYGSTPLESAFKKISAQDSGAIGDLFKYCTIFLQELDGATTYECWEKAVNKVKPRLALKQSELDWLHHFGKMIGTSDRSDQQKHLHLMMAQIKKIETEAREEQLKYEKMYKTLGFLSGALIVILML